MKHKYFATSEALYLFLENPRYIVAGYQHLKDGRWILEYHVDDKGGV